MNLRATRRQHPDRLQSIDSMGFRIWSGPVRPMSLSHSHGDIECNLVLSGRVSYLMAGGRRDLSPGSLALLWAGTPHRLISALPATHMIWLTLPLAWFLQWELDESLNEILLRGELALGRETPAAGLADADLFARWAREFPGAALAMQRILLLEVEARLRRFALSWKHHARPGHAVVGEPGQVERLTEFVGKHYQQNLSIARIAAAVGLNPNYAMGLFKKSMKMSLWDYLTRLRVSHAQRLLLSSDWKISRIAADAGFNTPGRFYAAFGKIVGDTPRRYRQKMNHDLGGP